MGGDVIIEVTLPFEQQNAFELEIGQINTAYRGFGHLEVLWGIERNLDLVARQLG